MADILEHRHFLTLLEILNIASKAEGALLLSSVHPQAAPTFVSIRKKDPNYARQLLGHVRERSLHGHYEVARLFSDDFKPVSMNPKLGAFFQQENAKKAQDKCYQTAQDIVLVVAAAISKQGLRSPPCRKSRRNRV
jgi:hypothetical protein